MSIGKRIARGREAEIFEWLPGDGDGRPGLTPRILGRWLSSWFLRGYLETYFAESGADRSNFDRWLTVMAAARLSENIAEESKHLVMMVRSGLSRE